MKAEKENPKTRQFLKFWLVYGACAVGLQKWCGQ
jgi:hypothetical protein